MNLLKKHVKWTEHRDKEFLNLLEPNSRALVIDLGCGKGEFTRKIVNRIGIKEIHGLDNWEEGIQECQKHGITILRQDLGKNFEIPSKSYDVVVTNQVIEHLYDPELFVKEIYRILKDDGYAVISTENLASWDNIIALLFGYTPFSVHYGKYKIGNPFSPNDKVDGTDYPNHVRIFSFTGLIEFLKIFGFKIISISATGHIISESLCKVDKKHCRFLTIKIRKN